MSIASVLGGCRTASESVPRPIKRLAKRTTIVHVIARATPLQFTSVVLTESAARPALHEGHEEGVCGERAQCVPSRCGFLTHEHVLGRPWYTPQRSHESLQMPDGHPPRQTQRHARVPGHEHHMHSHALHAGSGCATYAPVMNVRTMRMFAVL